MVNKVILIGNLGKDAEVRTLNMNNEAVKTASFPLATSEKYRDRNGNLQENTEWHNIVAWRGNAEAVEKLGLKKGAMLYIEGSLHTRKYTDQNGNDRYTTEVVVDTFRILDKKEA